MKLLLDHHYSTTIAEKLREGGHDVVAVIERGWEREPDESLLTLCAAEQRTILTNNVKDFVPLARQWAEEDRPHAGIVFTSDASRPRSRRTIGAYVKELDAFLATHPGDDAGVNLVLWL